MDRGPWLRVHFLVGKGLVENRKTSPRRRRIRWRRREGKPPSSSRWSPCLFIGDLHRRRTDTKSQASVHRSPLSLSSRTTSPSSPPSPPSAAAFVGLLSKRRRQGSVAALASSSSDALPADKVCPPFPFHSFLAVRNRTPKPPNVCYLYSDLGPPLVEPGTP